MVGGVGAILTLHHVRPQRPDAFQPNRLLEIEAAFLDSVIVGLRRDGFEFVSLDEAIARLGGRSARRFVALTFDDGYRDNVEYALPILKTPRAVHDVVCSEFRGKEPVRCGG